MAVQVRWFRDDDGGRNKEDGERE
uniref:Uncharacterized protein n=1 Tax=Nelumbo nucifera TaxID=4432 RepID=A0A822XVG3_NELNU|nr:TPA_asm: hypothetical protein HUJ06_024419 [Nelumbo nucifera]